MELQRQTQPQRRKGRGYTTGRAAIIVIAVCTIGAMVGYVIWRRLALDAGYRSPPARIDKLVSGSASTPVPALTRVTNRVSKIIWTYWEDINTAPTVVKTNFKYLDELYSPDWDVVVMTKHTVANFVPAELVELANKQLTLPAHKADVYRLCVVRKYGGVWMDASLLFKDRTRLERMHSACAARDRIALYFLRNGDNPADSGLGSGYLENWFIMSPRPGHPVVEAWYDEFVKAVTMGFDAYRDKIGIPGSKHNRRLYKNSGTYLTMHACIAVILERHPEWLARFIDVYDASDDMLSIHQQAGRGGGGKYKHLFTEQAPKLPCIKIIGSDRESVKDLDAKIHYASSLATALPRRMVLS